MIAAAILAVTIHETFHLITALSLPHTGSITLTPTSIQTVMAPGWPENTVILAGPLGSLALGALLGQEEVAFCAVTDEKVARELARLVTTLGAVRSLSAEGHHGSRSDEACRSPEGR